MKKTIIFSIVVLGISSIIGQLLIIRELTISFYGNEFFIGWILFSWLFWVGIGSLFLGKIFNENKTSIILTFCHILIAVLLPIEILLSCISRNLIAGPTGQIPNLIPALFYSFIILAPLCLILGLQFVIFSKFWKSSEENLNLSQILGKSYLLETLGFIIGGLGFSYFLIFINEFQTVSILAWLNLLSAGFIIFLIKKFTPLNSKKIYAGPLIFILIVVFIPMFIFSKNINNQTNSLRFPNQKLIESKNSIYGNIAVTKIKDQYNFYESGLFLGSTKEEIFNEYLVHLSLLYHPNPRKILLIGEGFNGILKEILKHQPEQIFYLELDPALIEITKKYLSDETRGDLENKKVKIINKDARYFIKTNSEKFDAIIINLPNPSTALINRFYTQEFIKEIKTHLAPQGILTTYLSSSPNYLSPETENLDVSIYKALKNTFASVIFLPEDEHFFIASENKLDYNPEILINRLNQRNIKTNFINNAYIEYRLTNDRVPKMLSVIENNQEAKINQDQLPISYYYNFTFWTSVFYPGLAKFLLYLAKIKFIWIIILFLIFWVLLLSGLRARVSMVPAAAGSRGRVPESPRWRRRRKQRSNTQNLLPLVMALAGFSLMAIEIIIILGFQIFYGYLYYKIALIITVLMAGMALGSWLGTKKIDQAKIKTLIKIHALIILFSIILFSIFYFLFKTSPKPSIFIEIIFLLMAGLIGGIVGFEFPIINKLYFEDDNKKARLDSAKRAGIIYGADLIGSCLAASLVSIFFIPIFGIFQTLILLAILNFLIIIPLIYFTSFSSKT